MNPSIKPSRLGPLVFLAICLVWLNGHPDSALARVLPDAQAGMPRASSWVSPIPASVELVKPYRGPATRFSAGHRGLDYLVTDKQPLLAPSSGYIAFANPVALIPAVSIQHLGGYRTTFEPACTVLPLGTPVFTSQPVATVCKPNIPLPVKNPAVTAAKAAVEALNPLSHCRPRLCLHFSLRYRGQYLSPQALIGGMKPSRLVR